MANNHMTSSKLQKVQLRVYSICRSGSQIVLSKGAINDYDDNWPDETPLSLWSFPIRKSPFDRKVKQNVGWLQEVDIIFFVSFYEVEEHTLIEEDLQKFQQVHYGYQTFTIKKVQPYKNFGNSFLYYLIGAVKI